MTEEIIQNAIDLLDTTYNPSSTGYYIIKKYEEDGCDSMDETFCENCKGKGLEDILAMHRNDRKRIVRNIKTFISEEYIHKNGKKIDCSIYDKKEVFSFLKKELTCYRKKAEFYLMSCDPDFSGGSNRPESCDECGEYFYTDFSADKEEALYLLEYIGNEKNSEQYKWELRQALYHYDYCTKDVQNILYKCAEILLKFKKQAND